MIVAMAAFAFMASDAEAFNFYSNLNDGGDSGTGRCADCHTAFRKGGDYISQSDGTNWGDTLHNAHLNNTDIGSNCDNCHGGANTSGRGVNLSSSAAGPGGAMALACVGCHGRQADTVGNPNALGAGWGAGLRQHHNANGVNVCLNCHADSDPNNFTPAGEDAMPMFYPEVTNNLTVTLMAPCNANGEENLAGLAMGLDNDGDNAYDTADPDCVDAPVCGNGVVEGNEACDDGENNGATACGCQVDCTYTPAGTGCADGDFCNGDETCDGEGTCDPGTTPCDPQTETCDEINDVCQPIGGCQTDADCQDDLFCNGQETCNTSTGECVAGTPPDCGDTVGCTDDSCDEVNDTCINTPNDANCESDNIFCNGEEVCDAQLDCVSSGDPCPPGDICDEQNQICITPECTTDADCDDQLFCNGQETCDANGVCLPGANPCPGQGCDETNDVCTEELVPPPVRQNLGFPDSSIGDLQEADCRFCHQDPNIVDDANIPNRHHLRVNTPVQDPTVRPFPDGDTNGNYDCYSCHRLYWDSNTQSSQFEIFRDCIFCHNTFSPHHVTPQAQAQNCDFCHGPVDNPFDGHPVGQNAPSLVTPKRSGGDGLPAHIKYDGTPVFAGGCDYCHDEGLTFGTGTLGEIFAGTNMDNHHNTNLYAQTPSVCSWCHDFGLPFEEQIRVCERCHGISSLHNIQVDSDATGDVDTDGDGIPDTPNEGNIIPNFENPYWGHIGNNDDCWGCHGFSQASGPFTGPLIPDISRLSAYSITQGADTPLTLTGSAFTNTVQTQDGPLMLDSEAVLTAEDGTQTVLATVAISESSMDVIVPGTLAPGKYVLHAVKGSSASNAVGLTVIPDVVITKVTCKGKRLTVDGFGFSKKPEGTDADLNIEFNGMTITDITSWSDTQIKARVSSCSSTSVVTVNALFGEDTDIHTKGKIKKPKK